MLFMVRMDVHVPHELDPAKFDALKAIEKARAEDLQRSGKWRHLWRIAGQYANVSVFDVADAAELHDLMIGLPLFPYMTTEVTALCRHPSAISAD
ncbi:muconolactone Delta-isomerase [Novosphingobium sp. PASSN1]|uniref:muconolactone Delta-isomerase n=1 Tax=Novosphingobium sp. PASSN1 TaxID=2015561 RepID=UPI000BCA8807|nr:muconolactone Delta-isomerase [Novosphingobium sp. PASSN1]OYU34487.1 MAG: muconolactone delta-isomerase [Novosphingobium sp. PASSN1]